MTATTPLPDGWLCLYPLGDRSSGDSSSASHVTLSLDNRGLAYGDGFFTTMGVIDGEVLWLDYHHQRLLTHAEALQFELDSAALIADLKRHAKHLQQGMLKLIVNRAAQVVRGYGYAPSISGSACEIWLKSSKMTVATETQIRLADEQFIPMQPASAAVCLASQIACLPPPLAGLKSLNRLDTVLASAELQRIKADLLSNSRQPKSLHSQALPDIGEGLVRDMSGHWVEGTMSNVFYQLLEGPAPLHESATPSLQPTNLPNLKDNTSDYLHIGQWYTPPMTQSGVAGVMRQVIIDTLSSTENPVIIRSLRDEDLPSIKQLFFCNALRGIMPMTGLTLLNGKVIGFK